MYSIFIIEIQNVKNEWHYINENRVMCFNDRSTYYESWYVVFTEKIVIITIWFNLFYKN